MNEENYNKAKELFSRLKSLKHDVDFLEEIGESGEKSLYMIVEIRTKDDPAIILMMEKLRIDMKSQIDSSIISVEKQIKDL